MEAFNRYVDEKKAEEEADGMCPACKRFANFIERSAMSTEPHGETFEDRWLECSNCGSQVEPAEVEALSQVLQKSIAKLERAL